MNIKLTLIYMAIMVFHVQADQGPDLYFPSFEEDALYILENTNLSVRFWLNTSFSKYPSKVYRLEVQTKRSDGTYEYDGRLVSRDNKCLITYEHAVHCTSDKGPAELYKTVNRSHEEIIFRWSWTDGEKPKMETRQRTMQLKILYNESVNSLNENGNNYTPTFKDEENETKQCLNKEQWKTILLTGTIICAFMILLVIIKSVQCCRKQAESFIVPDPQSKEGYLKQERMQNDTVLECHESTDPIYKKFTVLKPNKLVKWTKYLLEKLKQLHRKMPMNRQRDDMFCVMIPETSVR